MQRKLNEFNPLLIIAALAVLGILLIAVDARRRDTTGLETVWGGGTMGTYYQIKLSGVELDGDRLLEVKRAVEIELDAVNAAMSTYIPDSEISRFNRLQTGESLEVDSRFLKVMKRSLEFYRKTGNAFDPSLGPLIDLWGFGAGEAIPNPSEEQIAEAKSRMGFSTVVIENGSLRKTRDEVEINLSAIAKGYAVDRIAKVLEKLGYEHYFVDIGGDLICRGVNANGVPWRIGLQVPDPDAPESAMKVVQVSDKALATSGDYRNFSIGPDGRRHHIIDPRTGRPARHNLASVSVLADPCMDADAVATALFVMGTEEGMAWVESQPDFEALFIDRADGDFNIRMTDGFRRAVLTLP